jgi:hypothetical protein
MDSRQHSSSKYKKVSDRFDNAASSGDLKSGAGIEGLEAEKLPGGDFCEKFGLDSKECGCVRHFPVSRDQLRGTHFQGSGNMNPVERSQKNGRFRLDASCGDNPGAGLDIDA